MKPSHRLLATLSIAALPLLAFAQEADSHASHHRSASPGEASAPAAADAAAMARHLEAMQAFAQKMAAATTPAARSALMVEHAQLMQDGMPLMMQGGGMHVGMGKDGHQMMAKCMTMMESMMGMMKDGMKKTPAEPAAGAAK